MALQGERYTRHDMSHVDDVIDAAGRLLGYGSNVADSLFEALSPYEIYVLLFAILLHDAGNARQREEHEKQPRSIIARMGALPRLLPTELRLIAMIAEAHGGHTPEGSKDTIRNLIPEDVINIGPLSIRARMLAAVLRLADELSENPHRADPQALVEPYNPPQSAIHNVYCTVIDTRIEYSARTIYLSFSLRRGHLEEEFVLGPRSRKRILLVDYIAGRVEKYNRERQYCSRFMWPLVYDRIRVKLEIYNQDDVLLEKLSLELADEGYPNATRPLRTYEPRFDGEVLRASHIERTPSSGIMP